MLWWTLKQLKSTNCETRKQAVQKLGNLKDISVLEPLLMMLKDEDIFVRQAAVEALGNFGNQCPLEPLIAMFNDPSSSVQEAVLRIIKKVELSANSPNVVQALTEYERKREEQNRNEEKKKHEGEKQRREQEKQVHKQEELKQISQMTNLLKKLSTYYNDPRFTEKELINKTADMYIHTIETLKTFFGSNGVSKGTETFITLLNPQNITNKVSCSAAIRALSQIGDKRAVEPLLKLLIPKYEDYHEEVTKALGELGDFQTAKPLLNLLNCKDGDVPSVDVINAIATTIEKLGLNPIWTSAERAVIAVAKKDYKAALAEGAFAAYPLYKCILRGKNNDSKESHYTSLYKSSSHHKGYFTNRGILIIVQSLESVINEHASKIELQLLEKIAILKDTSYDEYWERGDYDGDPGHRSYPVSCHYLTELAKKEVERRKKTLKN